MPERELLVRIVGDDRDLQKAFKSAGRATQQMNSRMETFGKNVKTAFAAAGISFGAAAAFAGVRRAVSDASDLNEQITKNNAVFKQSAQGVQEWSKTTASAIGVSRTAALEATGTFGNLFNTVGLAPDKAAGMSKALVQLAADLASFNNANPSDVLAALRSGLIGEAEPLRRFGVLLSETRVQQEALSETGKTNVKALTDQEKALARYNIILKDTVPAQGDFERTQGNLANQTRKLQGQLTDLSAGIGSLLIPKLVETTTAANDLFTAFSRLREKFGGGDDGGGGRGGQVVSFLTQSLPAQFEDQADNLKRMARDIDLILQGKGFEKIKTPGSLKGVEELVTDVLKAFQESVNTAPIRIANGVDAILSGLDDAIAGALARTQKRELNKSQDAFNASIKGLGLKLSTAGLTESLQDDLAVLREIESRIERQIKTEGRTFKLQEQLISVRGQIQDKLADIAATFEEKQTAKVQAIADKAQKEREKRERIREREQRQREREQRDRKADQFQELGLTREGDKPTASVEALGRRLKSLREQVRGSILDTAKTQAEFDRIAKVLSKGPRKVGRDVRQAIQEMFHDINSALDQGGKGPLTLTSSLNSKQLTAGLGLSPEEIRALRGRLSHFNSAGIGLPGAGSRSTGSFSSPIVVESHTTVVLDGQKVASSVTRQQQKTKRRNPQQKRGPNRR